MTSLQKRIICVSEANRFTCVRAFCCCNKGVVTSGRYCTCFLCLHNFFPPLLMIEALATPRQMHIIPVHRPFGGNQGGKGVKHRSLQYTGGRYALAENSKLIDWCREIDYLSWLEITLLHGRGSEVYYSVETTYHTERYIYVCTMKTMHMYVGFCLSYHMNTPRRSTRKVHGNLHTYYTAQQ